MLEHRSLRTLALGLLLSTPVATLQGCIDDKFAEEQDRADAYVPLPVDDEMDAQPAHCPAGLPRIGEECPRMVEETAKCTYVIDECHLGSSVYPVTSDYCCFGGTWNQCGTNETPCDRGSGGFASAEAGVPATDMAPTDARAGSDAPAGLDAPAVDGGAGPDAGAPPADAAASPDAPIAPADAPMSADDGPLPADAATD